MKLSSEELLNNLKKEIPNTFKKTDEKVVKRIMNTTIRQIQKEIVTSTDDKVIVPQLGRFVKKKIEKDGETLTRVIFTPTKAKVK